MILKKHNCAFCEWEEISDESFGHQLWFQLAEVSAHRLEGERVLCKGLHERIGIEGARSHKANGGEWNRKCPFPTPPKRL